MRPAILDLVDGLHEGAHVPAAELVWKGNFLRGFAEIPVRF